METRPLRVGIIGAGAIAEHAHLPGYHQLSGEVEIAAIADIDLARAQLMAHQFGIQTVVTDYRELLEMPNLDAVSICTPNALHAEQTVAALRASKHVLCEKPMALSVADADLMHQVSTQTGKILMVGFTHRFMKANQWIKKQLTDGLIGDLYSIRDRFSHEGPYQSWNAVSDWFYKKELAGGGALLDMGIHAIDLLRYFAGEVTDVMGRIHTYKQPIASEDYAIGILTFESGCTGYFEVGWMSKPGFTGIEIYGSKGTILYDYQTVKVYTQEGDQSYWKTPIGIGGGGWNQEIEYFVRLVQGKNVEPILSVRDGQEAVRIAMELYLDHYQRIGKGVSM